jgi:D-alanine-D-alanine ligase-like ATP-grasp enzyme
LTIQADTFASYKLLAKALEQKGYAVTVDEKYPTTVTYTSPSGARWKTKAAHLLYPFNTEKVHDTSLHKDRACDLAKSIGVSIPHTLYVPGMVSDATLTRLLDKYGTLVVKPADSSLSLGLTIGLTSLAQLKKAIKYAKSFSSSILVQQQVTGEEVRFTVIDGKVEAALLRQTARVVGDGHSTISELIRLENEARERLHFERITYPQLDATLIDGRLLESKVVPSKGEMRELNHSTMVRGGCSVYDILSRVDKSYVALVEKLIGALGAGFIVVDLFCQSYETPAGPDNYWLIEFNTAPVLKLYYGCRDGKQFDIVKRLADMVNRWLHASNN